MCGNALEAFFNGGSSRDFAALQRIAQGDGGALGAK